MRVTIVARRASRLLAWPLTVLLILVATFAAALLTQYSRPAAGWAATTGHDAMWLGHAWVDGRRTERDVKALAVRLRGTGIRDVYVHSGPFDFDGTLNPAKYLNARNFLKWWRDHLPGVRVSAWLGQAVKNGLDLDDPGARRRVLDSARDIMATGFDGVHYNFEPIGDGDAEFLDLLTRTRAIVGERGLLTTSVPQVEPYSGLRPIARALLGHDKYWSRGYLTEVAARTDQIAIMTYDAGVPTRGLYGGHVVRQAAIALDLIPEGGASILIGAPAYHDHGLPLLDAAESVADAAQGARIALTDYGRRRERFGLALYVDFAATEQDWAEYRQHWLRTG
ncbi:hypothetical protein DP939_39170 [Spongiactinospora rosea]|uniref:GH18 domain-containing protein n=1 Tax=Spongiactinospora rosea TaxID=2248750 RepID=A0A366LNB5_9ACTN|nr:hypothetical protein [Spongiactinospora rosea]RBQ14794.1 hypothetical protein DP939_39170 [Spongiactinospora rosea]